MSRHHVHCAVGLTLGVFLMVVFSVFQKTIVGVSLRPGGFMAPVLLGALVGLFLARWRFKMKENAGLLERRNEELLLETVQREKAQNKLEEYRAHLEDKVKERTSKLARANEQLREGEARYRAIFENMSSGVAVYEAIRDGSDFVFKDFNAAGEKIDKVKRERLIGESLCEAFPMVKAFGLLNVLQRVWKTGEPEIFPLAFYQDERISGWRENFVCKLPSGEVMAVYEDVTERKLAEQALRESEEFSSSLLNNSPNPIIVINPDSSVRFVNPALEKLTGFFLAEVMGAKIPYPWWPEESRAEIGRVFQEALQKGADKIELLFQKKNGEPFWVEINSIQVTLNGEFKYSITNWVDITWRKRAEDELAEGHTRLALAMGLASLVQWEFDLASKVFTFNDQFYVLYATTAEKEGGYLMSAETYTREFVHPEDVGMVAEEVGMVLETTEKDLYRQVEHRIVRRDGVVRYIVVRYILVRDAEGRAVKTIGANQDITERKLAEEALRESEERFRAIYENAPVGIFQSTPEGKYLGINARFAEMSGYDPDELFQVENIADLYVDPDQRQEVKRLLAERDELKDYHIHVWRKDGQDMWMGIYVKTRRNERGEIQSFDGFVLDITERKRVEAALRESEEFSFSLLNNSPNPIMVINLDSSIKFVNPALEKLTGFSFAEIMGTKIPYPWWPGELLEKIGKDFQVTRREGSDKL
ncbi:MAG: PAS domain S-box protein, partial [Thermodesulfobacteriota bacterium]|nr:PAS domain S-box protein [Thermodesulfobacteriota bacterium]